MDIVTTVIRLFDIVIFTFGAGLSLALAIKQKHQRFRVYFLLAFGCMSLGVMAITLERIVANTPWNWAITPFFFISAILIVVTVIVAYKDHFK